MTPLESLRAWSLISVNFLIYCVPDLSLSCTNLNLGYPETFCVSGSPIEPCTYPTWGFRQEPGGEIQISPLPCSCMGTWQQGAERAVQPLLAASTLWDTHGTSCLQRTCTNLWPGSKSQHPCCWRGASFSEALSRTPQAAGALGCLTYLLQSLDVKETGGERKKIIKRVSGIHVVSEHPRQFSPRQVLLVPCDEWEQEHRVDGHQLLKAKAGDCGKDKTPEILI